MPPDAFQFGLVLLAAGSSRRMGRPKLLLEWGRTSVLGHLIQQWTALHCPQITVVCAVGDAAVCQELDRLDFPARQRIMNPEPERGMFSSIQCAASWPGWQPELTHWVIALGDQPHLREATLRDLLSLAAASPEKICRPRREGRPKHPVVLPQRLFLELTKSPTNDLKQFLGDHASLQAGFDSDDAGLDFDLDTPADCERLRANFL